MRRRTATFLMVISLASIVACGASETTSPTPTEQPMASLAVSPTNTPTAAPTAAPTTEVTDPPPLALEAVRLTERVRSGGNARVGVRTEPGAECAITVDYDSGPSDAEGLVPKTANARGRVTWKWTVGPSAAEGRYPITIVCSKGHRQGELSLEFTVR